MLGLGAIYPKSSSQLGFLCERFETVGCRTCRKHNVCVEHQSVAQDNASTLRSTIDALSQSFWEQR